MQKTTPRILLVDDHEDTRFMLTALLGRHYDAETASTVSEAIEISRSGQFDLYVLDNIFPDGTGTELCQKIRELHPSTSVIFYSAAVYESDREEGLRVGAQAYIPKPAIDELSETVQRVLGDRAGTVTEAKR